MKKPLSKLERVPLREAWEHDAHACRIATWRQNSTLEDEAQWPQYLDWFVQRIVKMNAVSRPVIQGLA